MKVSKEVLGKLELFARLSPKELEVLEHHVSVKERRRDEILFRVDDRAHSCLCLVEGKVGVFIPKEHQEENIATITAGQSVGHLALIDRKRRSATVRVTSDKARILELSLETFDRLFNAQSPLAFKIMDNIVMDLVGRIRDNKNKIITAKRERNEARLKRKVGQQSGPARDADFGEDDIEVVIPGLEQRMRDKRDG